MVDTIEVFTAQQNIINLQSNIINDLFLQLMQHMSVEEIDNMSCIDDINQVTKLRNTIME